MYNTENYVLYKVQRWKKFILTMTTKIRKIFAHNAIFPLNFLWFEQITAEKSIIHFIFFFVYTFFFV